MSPIELGGLVLAVRASDVAEAAADTLLAATSQALVMAALATDDPTLEDPPLGAIRSMAIQYLDRVIERTAREGPRPG